MKHRLFTFLQKRLSTLITAIIISTLLIAAISFNFAPVGAASNNNLSAAPGKGSQESMPASLLAAVNKKRLEQTESGQSATLEPKLTASDSQEGAEFGYSIAVSGDTAIVGATGGGTKNIDGKFQRYGAAYIFARVDNVWKEQQKLSSEEGISFNDFGATVAISGNTIVIATTSGGEPECGKTAGCAGVYIYVKVGTLWKREDKLKIEDGDPNASHSGSPLPLAISGNTIAVGVTTSSTFGKFSGETQIFVREGSKWNKQQTLTASAPKAGALFGYSLAIDSNTIVVTACGGTLGGTYTEGAAYVFVRNGTTWIEQQKLKPTAPLEKESFGSTVAIDGGTIAVGAPGIFSAIGEASKGSVYVFANDGTAWFERQKLTAGDGASKDQFGNSLAIRGNFIIVGAPKDYANSPAGAAYIFGRDCTGWHSIEKISASDGVKDDSFGKSVAISSDAFWIGSLNVNQSQPYNGAVYVYPRMTNRIAAPEGPFNTRQFGYSVAIEGDTQVIGVPGDKVNEKIRGAAYVFQRSGNGNGNGKGDDWILQQKIIANDGEQDDQFGISVSISGNTIVVGANGKSSAKGAYTGAAYVFARNGTRWAQQQKLSVADGAEGDFFGGSLAIDGDNIVVGSYGNQSSKGSVYYFSRSNSAWSQKQKLMAGDGAPGDQFGFTVALKGNKVAVGSLYDATAAGFDAGSAYIFTQSGSGWIQEQKIVAGDAAPCSNFGASVALSGDTVVVGSYAEDSAGEDAGAAYVFVSNANIWVEQQKLTANDAHPGDSFGGSVAISGDTIVVGAESADTEQSVDAGAAYVFQRKKNNWTILKKGSVSGNNTGDLYGFAVAIDCSSVVVGAPEFDATTMATDGIIHTFDGAIINFSVKNGCNNNSKGK